MKSVDELLKEITEDAKDEECHHHVCRVSVPALIKTLRLAIEQRNNVLTEYMGASCPGRVWDQEVRNQDAELVRVLEGKE